MNKEKEYKELIDSMIGCIKFKEERIRKLEEEIIDLRADYGTKTQVERDLAVDKIEELEEYIEDLKKRVEISKKDEESMRKGYREISKENWKLECKIDKAIEYIEHKRLYEEILDYDFEENPIYVGANCEKARNDLLNILKGSDK